MGYLPSASISSTGSILGNLLNLTNFVFIVKMIVKFIDAKVD